MRDAWGWFTHRGYTAAQSVQQGPLLLPYAYQQYKILARKTWTSVNALTPDVVQLNRKPLYDSCFRSDIYSVCRHTLALIVAVQSRRRACQRLVSGMRRSWLNAREVTLIPGGV